MTPFEEVYGKNAPSILPYMPGVSKVDEVDRNITTRVTIFRIIKENMFMDHSHMKQ